MIAVIVIMACGPGARAEFDFADRDAVASDLAAASRPEHFHET
jgi:hypothetical protein